MPLYLALTSVSALLAVSVYAIVERRNPDVSRNVYRVCIALCGVLFLAAAMPATAPSPIVSPSPRPSRRPLT